LRQIDIKILIAYSSVIHMRLVLGGIARNTYNGIIGALIIILGHGLCSSGMFYIANIYYERIGSRNIIFIRGIGLYFIGIIVV